MNLKAYLFLVWACFGAYYFYSDFKAYYRRMSQPQPGIDYRKSFISLIL